MCRRGVVTEFSITGKCWLAGWLLAWLGREPLTTNEKRALRQPFAYSLYNSMRHVIDKHKGGSDVENLESYEYSCEKTQFMEHLEFIRATSGLEWKRWDRVGKVRKS